MLLLDDLQPIVQQKPQRQTNKLVVLLIILLLVLIILVGVVIFLLLKPSKEVEVKPADTGGRATLITEQNKEEIQAAISNATPVPDGSYVTQMSIDWHFSGRDSADAYVCNAVENTRTVYFDLFLVNTGELIYSSPYIPVGMEMKGLSLEKDLEPGTYDTILVYHLVDDDKNELSTLSIALTIYVE